MSNLYWIGETQMDWLRPYFPKKPKRAAIEDPRGSSSIIFLTTTVCAGVMFCEQYGLYKMLYNRREKGG